MTRTLLLLAAAASAFAQPKGNDESPQRLVRLNVAAAKGDPVTDLRASEVQVREDGKLRPIVFFRFAGSKRPIMAPAAGETVNRPETAPIVILFDRWNEQIQAAGPASFDIGAGLQRLESVERIFIYFLTNHGDLYPVNPLPATGADLRAMAEPIPAELRAKFDEAVRKLSGFRDHVVMVDPSLRANTTFQALNALGTQMAYSIAGRRSPADAGMRAAALRLRT